MSRTVEETEDGSLLAAYREYEGGKLARGLMVANGLSVLGIPGGFVLDYFLYPDRFTQFLVIRFVVAGLLLGIIGLIYLQRDRVRVGWLRTLGVVSALLMNFAFCWMIFQTNGAASAYFAGLNLIITCWAVMLPWRALETGIMCVVSFVAYAAACALNAQVAIASVFPLFAFNSFFILITTAVCVSITFFLSRARFEEFKLRHQLDDQNRRLQDLDRLKTQFFSNVSHELRTPLTLILGPAEEVLSRGAELDADVHGKMLMVHRNTLRLLKLINDLLDLTRLDQGGSELRVKMVEVGPFVRGIVESLRHLGLSKRIRIRVEDGPESGLAGYDPERIEKVLINLLTNALKYTAAGGQIVVRWRMVDGAVVIEVQDTGVGIPAEDLGKVFDRFHQVRSNAANQNQGVGIGLALARELVEQHGGTLEVESEVGVGTTFRMTLPKREVTELTTVKQADGIAAKTGRGDVEEPFAKAFRAADRSWTYQDGEVEELPVMGSGERVVLVADDEPDMRRYIVSLLTDDYRVVQTSHGGNVLELVAEHRPEVVLLDWMMPGKDGLAVCGELRKSGVGRDLKIVLLTARTDEKSKLDALAAGADDFMTKPFSSVEVLTRVQNLARAGELQRELRARNDELQALIRKLEETETMLVQSEKMNAIGSLSAGLLHEINNPLNYTLTAISIANRQGDELSDDMKDILADIEEGMIRIRDVVTDLKTFAYPEKAGATTVFSVAEVVELARKIVAGETEGTEVEIDLAEGMMIEGQKTQMMHVFINLLNNAARAIKEAGKDGRGRILVRGWIGGETAEIEVEDTGGGISPENLNRVFEAFFTTREVGSGMGMGLSICHTIVTSHGGAIRVANRPGSGAVFSIQLPLAKEALLVC